MFLVWVVAILAIGYIVVYLIKTEFTKEKILSLLNIIKSGFIPAQSGREAAKEYLEIVRRRKK